MTTDDVSSNIDTTTNNDNTNNDMHNDNNTDSHDDHHDDNHDDNHNNNNNNNNTPPGVRAPPSPGSRSTGWRARYLNRDFRILSHPSIVCYRSLSIEEPTIWGRLGWDRILTIIIAINNGFDSY